MWPRPGQSKCYNSLVIVCASEKITQCKPIPGLPESGSLVALSSETSDHRQSKPVPWLPESGRLFALSSGTSKPQTVRARGGVLAPSRQKQENLSFKMGLDYRARPCLYKTKNKTLLRLLRATTQEHHRRQSQEIFKSRLPWTPLNCSVAGDSKLVSA